nr:PREDICTED: uncharacterized protein LOC105679600 isoform X1 [Linepithema humile]
MSENFTSDIDRLYDAVNSIHKSLQCTICLELMIEPVKTRCGHSFCKLCAAEVLQKKSSFCPLCKKKLDRRNISKDNHLQLCIEKFTALVSAIETDSHIDILSYSKRPHDTKESCSDTCVNKNSRRLSSKTQSTHQSSERQIEKSFSSRETTINRGDQQFNSSLLNKKSISNAFSKVGFTDDVNDMPEIKVRTWLHTLPDELLPLNKDDKVSMTGKTTSINQSEDDSKSDATSKTLKTFKMRKNRKTSKKQSSVYIDEDDENASQTRKGLSQPKKGTRARQSGKVKTIDSSDIDSNKLKYVGIHARVNSRERESRKKDATKPGVEETNNRENSTLTTATIEERDRSSLSAANTSSANWSGVLEFGKEIRAKKKKIKKLNVSTEKSKKLPQLVENIKLSNQYDLSKIMLSGKTSRDQANVSNLLKESIGREQDAADKSPNLSSIKTHLKASTETDARNEDVSFTKGKDINSTINLPIETSCITLEEGERIHIRHLNNDQVNQIIGIEDFQHAENQYREENVEFDVHPASLLSPRKRLTPAKLNKSTGCKKITPTAAQASIRNSKNSADLTIEDRIAGLEENSSVKRTPEEVPFQSPLSGRLSLRRKPDVSNNTNSPLFSQLSLADRVLLDRYESDASDCRNVDSRDKTQSTRMAAVRRHLNLDAGDIVAGSAAPRSTRNQGHRFSVKFIQLGTLFRRSNVRYFYLYATKSERALRVKFDVGTVCNMQQSISRQEMESDVAREALRDFVASANPSKDSQSFSNITVIENLHFADSVNANAAAVPEDAKFFSAATTRKVSGTSTSRTDIDRDLSRKRITAVERSSMKASERSTESAGDAEKRSQKSLHTLRARSDNSTIRKTSRPYASSTNSVKLLSPDKDSQLKFLAIDSPTSKSEDSKASSIRQQVAIKESNFAASTRVAAAQKSYCESSSKKRKRTRYAGDEGLFDDSDDSDVLFDVPTKLKCSRSFHGEKSDLDANKKRRLNFSDDQISKVISNSEEQHAPKKIVPILDSDTESKLSANVAENRKSHKFATSEIKESEVSESNSIFHSDNLDFMLQELMESNGSKTQKIANPSNDDIINRVLQIDQPRSDPDARRSLSSAALNDRTSQSKKNSGDYLLQDNFDETIANIDLPQSEDMMSSSEQPARNHSRTLVEQNTPNCPTMTDEPRDATQETPMISSTNDIFEHSSRNTKKLSARNASENFDKENAISHVHKKRESMDDRGNKKGTTTKHFVDTIDKDFHREITKHNASHEKEKSFSRAESLQTDKKHNVSTNSLSQLDENDTLMNVTQDQAHLQIFEQDLFSSPSTRKTTPKVASENDREVQRTPKRRKLNDRDENAAAEGRHAEEDDIVENTPERTRKSSESNIKTVESRKSTSHLSAITITSGSSVYNMMPLCESTPKVARPAAIGQSKQETILSGSILLPKQTDGKTSENVRQLSDRQQLCFVCTSLSKVQVSLVTELAAKHGANYVNQFDRNVTHVIVNTTGERNVARSTLKYLQGIAHRKWIVSYRWVEDCLEREKLLDEGPYEATTFNDGVIGVKGPRNSRLREKDLFEGFTFLCVKPYNNVSHSQYQDLLLATGATVVDSLEDLAKKGGMKGVVIQDNTHDIKTIERWYHTAKAAPIIVEWIVECIGQYKLLKLASQYLSVEDFQAIGYPRELVEEYEEYSDDEN